MARKENSVNKGKKRKVLIADVETNLSKVARRSHDREDEEYNFEYGETSGYMEVGEEMTVESKESCLWTNLDIILSIQRKDLSDVKKIELVFDFVNSRAKKEGNDSEQDHNIFSMSRLLLYVSNWIQSLLIISEKKTRVVEESAESQFFKDHRCWEIFKFCLEKSYGLCVSLPLSRDLLRVISCVAISALRPISVDFSTVDLHYYKTVSNCIELIFSPHGGLLNENLELWILAVSSIFELINKMCWHRLLDNDARNLICQFSCLVFEPFSKFVRVHPIRKNGFRDFVDKLLGPSLEFIGMMHDKVKDSPVLEQKLHKLVEEILSYGLFHSVHLDGYLSIHSTEKYNASANLNLEDNRTIIKSYHRHLFDRVDYFISEAGVCSLAGIGDMFQLFVKCVRKYKGNLDTEKSVIMESRSIEHLSKIDNLGSGKSDILITFSSEMRKSVFDFFVVTLEPLLVGTKKCMLYGFESSTSQLVVHYVLKSLNKMLSVVMYERVYLRGEGDFGGACLNFFKTIYDLLLSCCIEVNKIWQSTYGKDRSNGDIISIAKEFILFVGNFLEIEYEVITDDLVSIWRMILNCLLVANSSEDSTLLSETIDLGCRVLSLYSELRQVNHAVFTLCKGLRHLSFYQAYDGTNYELATLLHQDTFAKSGSLLLCSQKFRLATCNAVKSIPEGQVSGCVKCLVDDISDSLIWMKVRSSLQCDSDSADSHMFSIQAEIFGHILSEIYSTVLESLSVTTGNSSLIGMSIKKLIMVLYPSMSYLIGPEQVGVDEFLFSVTGITLKNEVEYRNDSLALVFSFFFRLYVSCRSIYCQTISVMPPNYSRKMSRVMADFCTAYSGQDCIEKTDFEDEGYFSWIAQTSAPLLSVMKVIIKSFLLELDHSCLIYVMHIMAFQRLVDLNRKIQSLEYIVQRNKKIICSKSLDDVELVILNKNKRRQKKTLSWLKEEAADLTGFVMEYLSLVHGKQLPSELCGRTTQSSSTPLVEFAPWDLCVFTVNEKTFPTAIWWIICQNIDVWCNHATKKNLKLFLSLLLNSPSYEKCEALGKSYLGEAMKVTKDQISQEHLRDTNLYDQSFVCRYIASTICDGLKERISLLFNLPNIDAELSACDWTKALGVLHKSFIAVRDKPVNSYCTSQAHHSQTHVAACKSLLVLVCQMMEKSLTFKSFSRCVTYLVNFERLIIGCLLDSHGTVCLHELCELLGLLVSSRRALKNLLMAFCDAKYEASKSQNIPMLSGDLLPTMWFMKSVTLVVAWCNTLSSESDVVGINDLIFSLMDHTSNVFLTINKYQFGFAILSVMKPKSKGSCLDCGGNLSNTDTEACESVTSIVETFEEQMNSFLVSLSGAFSSETVEVSKRLADLNKVSSIVSCIQGFLQGLESIVDDMCLTMSDFKAKLTKRKDRTISRINNFIDICVDFISTFSQIILHNDQPLKGQCDGQEYDSMGTKPSLNEGVDCGAGTEFKNQNEMLRLKKSSSLSPDVRNDSKKGLQSPEGVLGVLIEFGSFNHNFLKDDLLQSCLDGQNHEVAFFLRGLFHVSSAIIKLGMQMGCSPLPSNLVQILMGCSQVLLDKISCMIDKPRLAFLLLDGTLKFLATLGSQFLSTSPDTTRDIYNKLVELLLKAIGKCISVQGKVATLASHDIESNTKVFTQNQAFDPAYGLDELKTRIRMCFKILIENSSENHLLFVLQYLERVLVGAQEGCAVIYEVKRETTEGGMVSSVVAAGVDCLDLILEFVKGKKRLDQVKNYLGNLIAGLLNIIVHLQGSTLFYRSPEILAVDMNPDSGSVVLMCVEVLARVAAKPALFHLGSNYIGQFLHIPALVFHGFCNLRAKNYCSSLRRSIGREEHEHLESNFVVDSQFSINLYAASCRLLWTVIKHRKSECVRCNSLLQVSLQSLLHCLEIVDANSAGRKDYFSWPVEEGVKCASYLRRVYEEIRQQKDVLGSQCFMLLSDYIWLYSGLGPLKKGINREVGEALRPGVYALVDVCSPDELQYLHTVFEEGPCRSTLANLQHDYKLHFQYEGKV